MKNHLLSVSALLLMATAMSACGAHDSTQTEWEDEDASSLGSHQEAATTEPTKEVPTTLPDWALDEFAAEQCAAEPGILFEQHAKNAVYNGKRLILKGHDQNTSYFTERDEANVHEMSTAVLVDGWNELEDSFADTPAQEARLACLDSEGELLNVLVELSDPRLGTRGKRLTYMVTVLRGELPDECELPILVIEPADCAFSDIIPETPTCTPSKQDQGDGVLYTLANCKHYYINNAVETITGPWMGQYTARSGDFAKKIYEYTFWSFNADSQPNVQRFGSTRQGVGDWDACMEFIYASATDNPYNGFKAVCIQLWRWDGTPLETYYLPKCTVGQNTWPWIGPIEIMCD
jgi:hypothetical protein